MNAEPVVSHPTPALDAERCWQAVLARDARADGEFVYGVRSTGIYCRPSCPSRRARRDRVQFFATPANAAGEGFRACRRCQPDEMHADAAVVQRVCRHIESHLDAPLDLETLALHADLSPSHLQRVFKRVTGISPREYADACRLERFKREVRAGDTITDAIYEAGYGSTSRLYERTAAQLGMTPTVYRRGAAGQTIHHATASCPLGRLLVAATERGICMVSIGDTDAELEAALRAEFAAADLPPGDARLQGWVEEILRHLDGQQPHLELPLDLQATAFQWRVWRELQNIPYGAIRSYTQVAEALGEPRAARAVARACATNRCALIIPCHRVVRADGALADYRWGADRKRALLEGERGITTETQRHGEDRE